MMIIPEWHLFHHLHKHVDCHTGFYCTGIILKSLDVKESINAVFLAPPLINLLCLSAFNKASYVKLESISSLFTYFKM